MHSSVRLLYLAVLLTPAAVRSWHARVVPASTTIRSHTHAAASTCRHHHGTATRRLQASSQSPEGHHDDVPAVPRRFALLQATSALTASIGIIAGATASAPKPARAISADAAKDQWKQSVAVIDAILSDWSTLEKKGGDAIRVELGTQGTTSPLFQIDKALKSLREEAEDLVEFTEQSDEFLLRLAAADSMAYSANFAGGSGKPTPPAVYIEKSKKEVEDMQRIAKSLSALL